MPDTVGIMIHRGGFVSSGLLLLAALAAWQIAVSDPHPLILRQVDSLEIELTGRKRSPDGHRPDWIVERYFGE